MAPTPNEPESPDMDGPFSPQEIDAQRLVRALRQRSDVLIQRSARLNFPKEFRGRFPRPAPTDESPPTKN